MLNRVDFLDSNLLCYEDFTTVFGATAEWMNGWGLAGAKLGMAGQICMDLPSAALQTLQNPWITSAPASEDNGLWSQQGQMANGRWRTPWTNLFCEGSNHRLGL